MRRTDAYRTSRTRKQRSHGYRHRQVVQRREGFRLHRCRRRQRRPLRSLLRHPDGRLPLAGGEPARRVRRRDQPEGAPGGHVPRSQPHHMRACPPERSPGQQRDGCRWARAGTTRSCCPQPGGHAYPTGLAPLAASGTHRHRASRQGARIDRTVVVRQQSGRRMQPHLVRVHPTTADPMSDDRRTVEEQRSRRRLRGRRRAGLPTGRPALGGRTGSAGPDGTTWRRRPSARWSRRCPRGAGPWPRARRRT